MADPLITVDAFEARLGRILEEPELGQAVAFIDDASSLVKLIAGTDFIGETIPDAIVPVVVSMVRRALENPRGLTGETLGDHTWQAQPNQSTIYATRNEKRTIRAAVGKLSVATVALEGALPFDDVSWLEGAT